MARRILIVGSGGREDALGWKLSREGAEVYLAAGNAGSGRFGIAVPIPAMEFEPLADFAERYSVDLIVVTADGPLADGAVDYFESRGLRAFGPTMTAAQIEASKAFAKILMLQEGIPTSPFQIFENYGKALQHVERRPLPMVVKKSGLAFGKGSYPCHTREEARIALHNIMVAKKHGPHDNQVIIEDFLPGDEISIHALCDGKDALIFPPSQDHKRAQEGDQGGMTGGMGVVAPVAGLATHARAAWIVENTLRALAERKAPFKGLLYPGLMAQKGEANVLEFNARFGDPECQAYMRLLRSDLLPLLEACIDGNLSSIPALQWHDGFVACVVLASGGYPYSYETGKPITGIEEAEKIPGVVVFCAGTKQNGSGRLLTAGGRVLNVTATGATLREALDRAYAAVKHVYFEGMHYRRDIGQKALALSAR